MSQFYSLSDKSIINNWSHIPYLYTLLEHIFFFVFRKWNFPWRQLIEDQTWSCESKFSPMCNCSIIRTDSFYLTVTIIYLMNNLMSKWISYQRMISLCLIKSVDFCHRILWKKRVRPQIKVEIYCTYVASFTIVSLRPLLKCPWSSILTPVRTYESIRIVILYNSVKWSSTFHLFYRKNYLTLHL